MSHCIPVCGHTADMREKSFMVDTKKELAKLVQTDLYKRFFFTWGPSVCVERYFYKDACLVRLHLEGEPFYDSEVKKDRIWQEIEDLCAGVCQAMPFLSVTTGLERREKIGCDFTKPLPNITSLDKIVIKDKPEAKQDAKQATHKSAKSKKTKQDMQGTLLGEPVFEEKDLAPFASFADAGFAWDGQEMPEAKQDMSSTASQDDMAGPDFPPSADEDLVTFTLEVLGQDLPDRWKKIATHIFLLINGEYEYRKIRSIAVAEILFGKDTKAYKVQVIQKALELDKAQARKLLADIDAAYPPEKKMRKAKQAAADKAA